MMKIIKKIPLYSCEENMYRSAIYSGNSYKLLVPTLNKIEIFTSKLNKICSKNTCYGYEFITTYKCNDEYLVIKTGDYDNIYVIDSKYNELCTIPLNIPIKYKKKINSISFDSENSKIYIALDTIVYSITTQGDFIKEELTRCAIDKMRSSCSVPINNRCCNAFRPINIKITCAGFVCGNLVVSYVKNNSLFISEISKFGNIISSYYIDDDIVVDSIFIVKGKMELLVTKQGKYNYIYLSDVCCSKKICPNICEIVNVSQCRVDCECTKPKKEKNCKEDICDIIESIALEETAISHILNAEGEKIQKAVKIACNCEDLIKVNESVSRTITNVTMLESVLLDKLSLTLDCICKNKK